ncbi:MAG: GNAT family N-acetyltransferase, partial [Streptosporangiaceae bacterium]
MCSDEFMIFWGGGRTTADANRWFDGIVATAEEIPFGKQPLIVRDSGVIAGYAGVGWFDYDGDRRLEFGWRLAPEFRGLGYATEASRALLGMAADAFAGEILAIIHRDNQPSRNVARKLGFGFLAEAQVDGGPMDLYAIRIG